MNIEKAIERRRSYYGISKASPISDDEIIRLVTQVTQHAPSSYNSQSQMSVVLFGEHHDKLWDIVLETLRGIVPADKFAPTQAKINGFKAGYGTILFFNDDKITQDLQTNYPLYAEKFHTFAEQAIGMVQYGVWALLEAQGLGASLQHYNPLIDTAVKDAFGLPATWCLFAQMPFGTPTMQPPVKKFSDITTRVKIFR